MSIEGRLVLWACALIFTWCLSVHYVWGNPLVKHDSHGRAYPGAWQSYHGTMAHDAMWIKALSR